MGEFVRAIAVGDLQPGKGRTVLLNDKQVAVFNVGGTFYAIEGACTHVGGPLGEGELNDTVVTCPLHGATFDVSDGRVLGPPAGDNVASYEVNVEGDDVMVRV